LPRPSDATGLGAGTLSAGARILAYLATRSQTFVVGVAVVLVLLLGTLDFLTGFEVSFAVFYVAPVALVAWYASTKAVLLMSIASAVTWQAANSLAGEQLSAVWIPIWNASTRLGFFLVIALLLAKLKESLAHERDLARTDFLTGAANPRAFYELGQLEINRARRYGRPFSIAYFDADNFKFVNDRLGHHIGSQLLVRAVEVMRQNSRTTDVVARIGGDEFAMLLPETGVEPARIALTKLRDKLLDEMRANDWPVTFSVGLLTCTDPPHTVDELIRIVDGLMYQAKQRGKNALVHEVLRAHLIKEPVP
jgi:diguanylate cyclase (GGDEF)-like protein